MNYYNEIKTKLIENENYTKIKEYSKENHKVKTYFEIGKLLHEAGKHYGENIIKQYSVQLQKEVGKKYNERTLYGTRKFYKVFSNPKLNPLGSKLSWTHYRTLFRIRQFYITFKDSKVSPMGTQLSWSHFKVLLPIKEETKLYYYINIFSTNNLTKRELETKLVNITEKI